MACEFVKMDEDASRKSWEEIIVKVGRYISRGNWAFDASHSTHCNHDIWNRARRKAFSSCLQLSTTSTNRAITLYGLHLKSQNIGAPSPWPWWAYRTTEEAILLTTARVFHASTRRSFNYLLFTSLGFHSLRWNSVGVISSSFRALPHGSSYT